MTIGERIIKLREGKGWSQRELARRVNLNFAVMNRIEKGTRPLQDDEIIKIADVLEVSTDYLLRGESYRQTAERIVDDPGVRVASSDGEISREEKIKMLEWLLEAERGRKPGDEQKKK
ncbi:helix-turn-helix domain-containing protein [Bacillus gobiensis]|uniref:helix-turn-helix domain-containing protein n=1 Tax=Bacillus gobiensis TaxID=1441095 RepID=UPI003D1B8EE7